MRSCASLCWRIDENAIAAETLTGSSLSMMQQEIPPTAAAILFLLLKLMVPYSEKTEQARDLKKPTGFWNSGIMNFSRIYSIVS